MKFESRSLSAIIAVTLMAGVAAPSANAQDAPAANEDGGLEEIVVVARKRAEDVQDVPISITALSGDALKDRGVARVADLVGGVPNLTQDGGGSVLGAFGLRGIVSQTRNIGFDSGLGVYVDGVLTVRANGGDQELPDIATLEVLRGPQGTLFGRNTTAGAINITTRKPNLEKMELNGRIAYGNLDQKEASLFVSGPVIADTLGIKVAGSLSQRDGYLTNVVDGRKYNGVDRKTVRGGLYWEAGETLSLALSGSYLEQDDSLILGQVVDNSTGLLAGAPGFFADPYTIAQDAPNRQQRKIWTTNLNVDLELGNYTLTSISAYGDNKSRSQDDDDVRPIPLSASDFRDGATQFTQELRLASPAGGTFDYLVGLYYLNQKADSNRSTAIIGPPGPGAFLGAIRSVSDLSTDAYAGFVSFNLRPSEKLTIAGGLRYSKESKTLAFNQVNTAFVPLPNLVANLKRKDDNFSGNFSVSFQPVDDTHVYASVARGFKSGGFNPDIVGDTNISFGPENAWSYEAGVKSELLDRRLRVNAAAFITDYKDLQVSALVGAAFQIKNAAAAKIKGFELEITAKPSRAIEFNAGVGYTDATYKDFPGCAPVTNCAGLSLPYVPKWTVNAGVQLNQSVGSGELVARTDVILRDSVFYEATNAPDGKLPGYTLVNAKLGYQAADKRWGIGAFAKNLFDVRYRDFSLFLAPFQQRQDRYAVPRTYGVELTVSF